MKWEDNRRSSNVEDRRNESPSNFGSNQNNSMLAFLPIIKMLIGTKIGRIILIIGAISYFMGFNPLSLLDMVPSTQNSAASQVINSKKDDNNAQFVSAVLAQTEDIWIKVFQKYNASYVEPKLVLFRNSVRSACGNASSETGPFYCPVDQKVYLDLSFFDELAKRHDAPGDFAQAYVIAHEIGHHVQTLLGTSTKMREMQQGKSQREANRLSVALELQADFYAGVWTHYNQQMNNFLEEGDIEEALSAAHAVGDDAIQSKIQGHIVPESFTHGTSEQRKAWFMKGYKSGDINQGNTFAELR